MRETRTKKSLSHLLVHSPQQPGLSQTQAAASNSIRSPIWTAGSPTPESSLLFRRWKLESEPELKFEPRHPNMRDRHPKWQPAFTPNIYLLCRNILICQVFLLYIIFYYIFIISKSFFFFTLKIDNGKQLFVSNYRTIHKKLTM